MQVHTHTHICVPLCSYHGGLCVHAKWTGEWTTLLIDTWVQIRKEEETRHGRRLLPYYWGVSKVKSSIFITLYPRLFHRPRYNTNVAELFATSLPCLLKSLHHCFTLPCYLWTQYCVHLSVPLPKALEHCHTQNAPGCFASKFSLHLLLFLPSIFELKVLNVPSSMCLTHTAGIVFPKLWCSAKFSSAGICKL